MDKEELMSSAKGKGHVVLPIYWLQPHPVTNAIAEDSEEDGSKVSVRMSAAVSMVTIITAGSQVHNRGHYSAG